MKRLLVLCLALVMSLCCSCESIKKSDWKTVKNRYRNELNTLYPTGHSRQKLLSKKKNKPTETVEIGTKAKLSPSVLFYLENIEKEKNVKIHLYDMIMRPRFNSTSLGMPSGAFSDYIFYDKTGKIVFSIRKFVD